ncbi:MAG TPA: DUF4276 family protein [Thermoanaerobaculia bacterium]|nr:DUF4276 family protein [Thermoanaerobaculia bacterium]
MSRRILILVEGQTEERFVKDVLAPEFYQFDTFFDPRLLITKVVKHGASFKGGVTTYGKYKNDVRRLLAEAKSGTFITTLVDYYGLPADFPGMETRPNGSPRDRVRHIENNIFADCGSPQNFRPFLALHEFEAWLFSSRDELSRTMTQPDKRAAIAAIRDAFPTPEDINEGPATAPSKRIKEVFPEYKKTLHGPLAAARIGVAAIRAECAHFDEWLGELEVFATS